MSTAQHPTPEQTKLLDEIQHLNIPPEELTRALQVLEEKTPDTRRLKAFVMSSLLETHPLTALPDVPDSLEVSGLTAALKNVQRSILALGAAMASNPAPASPQLARSLQAAENVWRGIEEEFTLYTSIEVAAILGARKPNRNAASEKRSNGRLIGILRGNSYRYPGFQFDTDRGEILPIIPQLIALARENDRTDEDLVYWLVSPSTYFRDGGRPVEHIREEGRLLAAAADQFEASW